jgi:hypothetical protein
LVENSPNLVTLNVGDLLSTIVKTVRY